MMTVSRAEAIIGGSVAKDDLVVQDLDLALLVPTYKVMKQGFEFGNGGGKVYVVHLRRKDVEIPLFVRSFYLACYTAFLSRGINPESKYCRMHYKKNYYTWYHGKRRKNVKLRYELNDYLSWHKRLDKYNGHTSVYYFVMARFNDPSCDDFNIGFTVQASSINAQLYICKEMLDRIGNPDKFDFGRFFEDFLFGIGYPKSMYVLGNKYGTLHRLYAMQRTIQEHGKVNRHVR